jgi:hypothetical protein
MGQQVQLLSMSYQKHHLIHTLLNLLGLNLNNSEPSLQSKFEKAAADRVNFMQLIFITFSWDGIVIDKQAMLPLLHGQSTIFPLESKNKH